ncbi:SoxR reducing system RseC family protein [Bacteroides sp. 519]|uniref:SoxR reducing system RseC family protein n=1 Tax=Bacteroides sp. 519 TaxID=2302937 RepID=UPI0013D1F5BF|nr:SoxR reducing system RseC family protein [Bacteroides sp. 519]NDV60629.1 RseC/MucC family positive regulator of sigma(E) [Bacteroides sp. 519]
MVNVISHPGVVESIDGSHVFVRIVQTSACASCSIKGHCSAADNKEKIIEVTTTETYQVGDKVEVYGETSMGMRAVLLAFIIPFFVLVISLFGIMWGSNDNELLSVGISFLLLVIYYTILSKNKTQLKRKFLFKIKTLNN